MKIWILRFKATDQKNFDEIKDGSKLIETRAATVKYRPIQVGDTLIFTCKAERLAKKVLSKRHFVSIEIMIKTVPYQKIMPSVKSIAEMERAYSSYTGYDKKIRTFGLFAFELG